MTQVLHKELDDIGLLRYMKSIGRFEISQFHQKLRGPSQVVGVFVGLQCFEAFVDGHHYFARRGWGLIVAHRLCHGCRAARAATTRERGGEGSSRTRCGAPTKRVRRVLAPLQALRGRAELRGTGTVGTLLSIQARSTSRSPRSSHARTAGDVSRDATERPAARAGILARRAASARRAHQFTHRHQGA